MKNVAIILAGGSGSRFGGNVPKQFQLLNKRRIIDYSIKEFENHDLINKIIIDKDSGSGVVPYLPLQELKSGSN